jgi:tRNA pseudouridine synthase 10
LISEPILGVTDGEKTAFHASGREDIDAKMLGTGRPFVVEISKPRKRFVDLNSVEKAINALGKGKVRVSTLRFADRDLVRKLKKSESAQKEPSSKPMFSSIDQNQIPFSEAMSFS